MSERHYDADKPIQFVYQVDPCRKFMLRGTHWFVQDNESPECLWGLASGLEIQMATELEKLRNALIPFANVGAQIPEYALDHHTHHFDLLVKDYRKAHEVLCAKS